MWQRRRNDPTLQDVLAEDEASWGKDEKSTWGKGPPPRAARSNEDFQFRTVRPEDDEAAENVLWQQFESIENQTAMDDEEAAASVPLTYADPATSSSSGAPLDYVNLLPTAIAHESHHLIARCLRTALQHDDHTWIRSLPESTFTQILTLLSPSHTLGQHIETHTSISPALTSQLQITPLHEIVSEYSELLGTLFQIRWSQSTDDPSTVPVTLPQYNLLLRAAATLGNRNLALRIWKKMTTQPDHFSLPNAVAPDIESYNALMSAVTFNRQLNPLTRYRHRVIPFHMHARNPEVVREVDRGIEFKGYSVSSAAAAFGGRAGGGGVGAEGVKGKILRMLQGLLEQGVKANEETWRVVILAAAREGDLGTVEKVIARVWGVEVGRIGMEGKEEESTVEESGKGGETATNQKHAKGGKGKGKESNPNNFIPYPPTSPLHPTPALLTTLAHAYSINNALQTALKLVDHFSRCYALSIPHATWSELLEWTFVLSVPRTGQKAQYDGTKTGQLPLSAVGDLWGIMTGERSRTTETETEEEGKAGKPEGPAEQGRGYNVQPDMRMYDYLVKNLVLREMGPEVLRRMQEGRELYYHSKAAAREARAIFLREQLTEQKRRNRWRLRQWKKQEMKKKKQERRKEKQERKKKKQEEETPLPSNHNADPPPPNPPPSETPDSPTPPPTPPSLPPELLYPSYPTYAHLALLRNRHIRYLRRWVRLLLRLTRSIHYPDSLFHNSTFSLRTLPRFLHAWRAYAPSRVRLEVPAGMLEFDIRSQPGVVGRDDGCGEGLVNNAQAGRSQGPDLFGTHVGGLRGGRLSEEGFWSEGDVGGRGQVGQKVGDRGDDEDWFKDDELGEDESGKDDEEVEGRD
ncbi:hypothetical protein NU219Hw_g6478t1 [Hortaea werneckii]